MGKDGHTGKFVRIFDCIYFWILVTIIVIITIIAVFILLLLLDPFDAQVFVRIMIHCAIDYLVFLFSFAVYILTLTHCGSIV